MKTEAWAHQRQALRHLKAHPQTLLHMGMGTGKSRVIIDLIESVGLRKTLILCPLSVVQVWTEQWERHASVTPVIVSLHKGSVRKKTDTAIKALKYATQGSEQLVVVINYDSARNEPFRGWSMAQDWDLVVCDESHRIKSPGSKTSLYCSRLRVTHQRRRTDYPETPVQRRVCLTGTPMPHSPLDVYAQFRFLDPSVFGNSFTRFRACYAVMGGYQNHQVIAWQHMQDLASRMGQITYTARSEDVLDLPPVTHTTRYLELSRDERRVYKEIWKDFVAEVEGGTVTAANALVKLLRVSQVTGGSVTDSEGRQQRVGTSKQKVLSEVLEGIGHEPVVVFCRFRADLDQVHETAEALGHDSFELSGRRKELLEWQQLSDIDRNRSPENRTQRCLAVQLQAGGVGVDLTAARYCLYWSVDHSLGNYEQSLARVHRPGQEHPVTYIHLVARGTVDETIYAALEKKSDVVKAVLESVGGVKV